MTKDDAESTATTILLLPTSKFPISVCEKSRPLRVLLISTTASANIPKCSTPIAASSRTTLPRLIPAIPGTAHKAASPAPKNSAQP
jgi:hypothetical protein